MFADSSARDCARTSPVFVAAIAILAGSLFFATPASAAVATTMTTSLDEAWFNLG